jgi:DNA-binding transcriptional LysR family regulator
MVDAVVSGAGIGFVSTWDMRQHPELIEVMPSQEEWTAPLWLVTHVDLHRTTKVQAFLKFLKEKASDWEV